MNVTKIVKKTFLGCRVKTATTFTQSVQQVVPILSVVGQVCLEGVVGHRVLKKKGVTIHFDMHKKVNCIFFFIHAPRIQPFDNKNDVPQWDGFEQSQTHHPVSHQGNDTRDHQF